MSQPSPPHEPLGPPGPGRPAAPRGVGTLVALGALALPVLLLLALGVRRLSTVGAAPRAQDPPVACAWRRLARGDDRGQHTLVRWPGVGVLAHAGGDRLGRDTELKGDLRLLDLRDGEPGAWREIVPSGATPAPRADHVAVLRPAAGAAAADEMIAYGGLDHIDSGTFTWRSPLLGGGEAPAASRFAPGLAPLSVDDGSYRLAMAEEGGAWSGLGVSGPPLAEAAAVYWPAEDAMLVFGGRNDEDAASVTYALQRVQIGAEPSWETRAIPEGPSPRMGHSAVWDDAGQRMIVFGGTEDWVSAFDETWALELDEGWDAARWTRLETQGAGPAGRFDHAAAPLPERRWMLVYGGTPDSTSTLDDTWALDLAAAPPRWLRLDPAGDAPPPLQDLAGAYSPAGEMAVFYGGEANDDSKPDAWGLACGDVAPPTEAPTGAPSATPTDAPTAPPVGPIFLPELER